MWILKFYYRNFNYFLFGFSCTFVTLFSNKQKRTVIKRVKHNNFVQLVRNVITKWRLDKDDVVCNELLMSFTFLFLLYYLIILQSSSSSSSWWLTTRPPPQGPSGCLCNSWHWSLLRVVILHNGATTLK